MTADGPPQNSFELSSSRTVLQALQALSSSAKQVRSAALRYAECLAAINIGALCG